VVRGRSPEGAEKTGIGYAWSDERNGSNDWNGGGGGCDRNDGLSVVVGRMGGTILEAMDEASMGASGDFGCGCGIGDLGV